MKPQAVNLIGTCPHCGEAVEMVVSKTQVKALLKGFKQTSISKANMTAEKSFKILNVK